MVSIPVRQEGKVFLIDLHDHSKESPGVSEYVGQTKLKEGKYRPLNTEEDRHNLLELHRRLGHPGGESFRKTLAEKGSVIPLALAKAITSSCTTCCTSNARFPRIGSRLMKDDVDDGAWARDLFFPAAVGVAGGRLVSLWINRRTGFLSLKALVRKSQAKEHLEEMLLTHKVNSLRQDNDTVFQDATSLALCQAHKVHLELSAPYTPESNGSAERAVRTVNRAP